MRQSKKLRLIIAFILLAIGNSQLNAQISVSSGGVIPSANYGTLKASFDAINAGQHTGIVNITITGNTNETSPAKLAASGSGSASYTAVNIVPFRRFLDHFRFLKFKRFSCFRRR